MSDDQVDTSAEQVDTCQMLVGSTMSYTGFERCDKPAHGTLVGTLAVIRVCRACGQWAEREGQVVLADRCDECDGEFEHWPGCSLYVSVDNQPVKD